MSGASTLVVRDEGILGAGIKKKNENYKITKKNDSSIRTVLV